jgi:hypothetical protein
MYNGTKTFVDVIFPVLHSAHCPQFELVFKFSRLSNNQRCFRFRLDCLIQIGVRIDRNISVWVGKDTLPFVPIRSKSAAKKRKRTRRHLSDKVKGAHVLQCTFPARMKHRPSYQRRHHPISNVVPQAINMERIQGYS